MNLFFFFFSLIFFFSASHSSSLRLYLLLREKLAQRKRDGASFITRFNKQRKEPSTNHYKLPILHIYSLERPPFLIFSSASIVIKSQIFLAATALDASITNLFFSRMFMVIDVDIEYLAYSGPP